MDKAYQAEGVVTDLSTFATSIVPLLRSGVVIKNTGLKGKWNFVKGIAKYRFTCSRQLWYSAQGEPERVAIIDDFGQITYGEMLDQAEALARYFEKNGLGEDKRIGVMARNSRVIPLLLAAKGFVGADIYLLNVAASPHQLQESIVEHNLDAVFMDDEFGHHLPADWDKCQVYLGHVADPAAPNASNPEWKSIHQIIEAAPSASEVKLKAFPKQGGIVIMSSGTSGTPKGVRHREPLFPLAMNDIIKRIGWREHMMIQQTASQFHSWGWANVNIAIAHRATVILRRVFNPVQAMEDLEKYQATAMITSPIFLKDQLKVANEGDYNIADIDFIVSSGNAMHTDLFKGLVEYFGPVVRNFYGSTENSVATIADSHELLAQPNTAGKPVGGVRLRILDEDGKTLGPNQPGRIFCRGIMTMRSYTNPRDKMCIERGLLAIGDKGYVDEEGRLFVLGRADDMIIVGGENVYPRSVEEVLYSMPGIKDLFAHGVKDEETFQRMKVWLVREDSPEGDALTEEAVQKWVGDNLLAPAIPREVVFMDELPRNPTGKVMPRKLPGIDD